MPDSYYTHPTAFIDDGAIIGKNCKIWHFVHIRSSAQVGENTILGKNVYIDTKVKIGSNCKIQNNVSVYQGVTIEDNVFVGPHVVFTNDVKPRAQGDWVIIDTNIHKGASIGANSVILCGIKLGQYCMIGAGSVVTKNVPKQALFFGNPAKFQGVVCNCGEKVAGKDAKNGGKYFCLKCSESTIYEPDSI